MQYMRWRVFMSERCLIALAVGVRELYELFVGEQAKLASATRALALIPYDVTSLSLIEPEPDCYLEQRNKPGNHTSC